MAQCWQYSAAGGGIRAGETSRRGNAGLGRLAMLLRMRVDIICEVCGLYLKCCLLGHRRLQDV